MSETPPFPEIPAVLQTLTAVVAAWLTTEGRLVAANQGFSELVQIKLDTDQLHVSAGAGQVGLMFIQPGFDDLVARCKENPETGYQGLLSLGSIDTGVKTLTGTVRLTGEGLYLLAQYDITEYESQQNTLLELNESLAEMHRELARANRSLDKRVKERTVELETALKQSAAAEQALRLSLQDTNDIMNSMVNGIVIIDESGSILSCNQAAQDVFGYAEVALQGRNVKMLMPDSYASHHDGYLAHYLRTGENKIIGKGREVVGLRKDGSEFPMYLSVAEMHTRSGDTRRFIGSCVDLTEKKRQELLLSRSQKMDALGQLTGGIAHDFNNLLGIILGYTETIIKTVDKGSNIARYADHVFRAAERGAKLTHQLLGFSRAKIDTAEVFDVNNFLVEEWDMLSKLVTARILLKLKLQSQLWPVQVDIGSFEDAIINLAINAMHAIEDSGQIVIQTINKHIENVDRDVDGLQPGDYVLIRFSDTGSGMDAETVERIFDPFFSTKGEKGTGLGLSQLYGFMNRHGGCVDVESAPGVGTTFELYFPRHEEPLSKSTGAQATREIRFSQAYTVLVVDDEPELAQLNQEIIDMAGLRAISAYSSEEAIKILAQKPIDLLLTDIVMPNMDGYALADYVFAHFPWVKVQLMSGFAGERSLERQDDERLNTILSKPCTSRELLERLHQLLESR